MKHNPLRDGDNALLSLVQGRKLSFYSIVRVCHCNISSFPSLRMTGITTLRSLGCASANRIEIERMRVGRLQLKCASDTLIQLPKVDTSLIYMIR